MQNLHVMAVHWKKRSHSPHQKLHQRYLHCGIFTSLLVILCDYYSKIALCNEQYFVGLRGRIRSRLGKREWWNLRSCRTGFCLGLRDRKRSRLGKSGGTWEVVELDSVWAWEIGYEVDWARENGGTWEVVELLSVVKAWVGEIPHAPYVSTETIAHGTISHVIAVSCTRGAAQWFVYVWTGCSDTRAIHMMACTLMKADSMTNWPGVRVRRKATTEWNWWSLAGKVKQRCD